MKLNNEKMRKRLEAKELLAKHIEAYRKIIYEARERAKNQETRDMFENEQDYNELLKSIEIEIEFCENLFVSMKKLYEGEQILWDSHTRRMMNVIFMVVGQSILYPYPTCLKAMAGAIACVRERYKAMREADGAVELLKGDEVTLQ